MIIQGNLEDWTLISEQSKFIIFDKGSFQKNNEKNEKGTQIEFAAAIFNPYIVEQQVISYSTAFVKAISNRMRHCPMPLHRQYCKKSLIAQECND